MLATGSRGDFLATRRGAISVAGAALLTSCAGVGAAPGASEPDSLEPDRASAIDAMLRSFEALAMFNGTVTIDRGGQIVFRRDYGWADYELRRPFNQHSKFRIASLSKNMTNAALATMLVRGDLSLEDRLQQYMPEFPGADRITIALITQHRSGIPHTNDQLWGDGSITLSPDDVIRRLAELPLDFEPGARRSYSNGGYAVLARVMEMARSRPYREIMRELVFQPLGMDDSGEIQDSYQEPRGLVAGYQPGPGVGERQRSRFYAVETRQGGGSLYASNADVMRFFRAAFRDRLPGAAEYPNLFGGSAETRVADGRSPGFYMDVDYDRAADLLVVSTANNYAADFAWAENIARLALGRAPLFAAPPPVDVERRASANDPWIGSYRNENPNFAQNLEIERTRDGRLLLVDHDDSSRHALIPLQNGGYLEPLYYGVCRQEGPMMDRIICSRLYPEGFTAVWLRR